VRYQHYFYCSGLPERIGIQFWLVCGNSERTFIFARKLIQLQDTDMPSLNENVFPVFHEILGRSEKERLLNQRAKVIWLTGLSGSGKTTLATSLETVLFKIGYLTQVLDGDNIRSGINNNLGFSDIDRFENIRRIAEISKLFVNCGVITINCFISPTEDIRNMARGIIGRDDFIEIYVNAPLKVCEERDVKGLYSRARRGEIKDFTGITSPFETPEDIDFEIRTDLLSIEESTAQILEVILPRIDYGLSSKHRTENPFPLPE
jgi:adenylylsulfate kinase